MVQVTYPFLDYIKEDKSKYKTATEMGFIDPDNDWLVGESGGFLPNINFSFINTDLFRQPAIFYEKHKCYTFAQRNSQEENDYRLIERDKRRNGFTALGKLKNGEILPLRITGDHYNFLNYGRMYRAFERTDKYGRRVIKKDTGFPRFFASQYRWFKAKEFARLNGFHLVMAKSRRGGVSYMEAISSANIVNLNKGCTVILAAADKKYLVQGENPTAGMVRKQLLFYDRETPFEKGLISLDLENLKLGFKDKKTNSDMGQLSSVIAISFANDPNSAAGKDAITVEIDELTDSPGLKEFLDMTEPTTRTGSDTTGMIIGFGTGGGKKRTQDEFERLFYKPSIYGFMPFENIYDDNARETVCGYYKPYIDGLEGVDEFGNHAIDEFGNSIYNIAIKICEKERLNKRRNSTPDAYIKYCSQYSNKPSESFSGATDNMFASPELNSHIDNVRINNDFKFYIDGSFSKKGSRYVFKSNNKLEYEGIKTHSYITRVPFDKSEDFYGCFRQYFPPPTVNNIIPDNLIRIWYDPIGVNKDKNEVTNKNSLACFIVYLRTNNLGLGGYGDLILGIYVGRPNTMIEIDKLILSASYYYNAKILVENNRGETVSNFRAWHELGRLIKEPTMAWDTSIKTRAGSDYGISIGDSQIKLNGLSFLYDYLYTKIGTDENNNIIYRFHKINDLPLLLELQKFKFNGNFDRISAFILGMFDIKELTVRNIQIRLKGDINKHNFFKRTLFK